MQRLSEFFDTQNAVLVPRDSPGGAYEEINKLMKMQLADETGWFCDRLCHAFGNEMMEQLLSFINLDRIRIGKYGVAHVHCDYAPVENATTMRSIMISALTLWVEMGGGTYIEQKYASCVFGCLYAGLFGGAAEENARLIRDFSARSHVAFYTIFNSAVRCGVSPCQWVQQPSREFAEGVLQTYGVFLNAAAGIEDDEDDAAVRALGTFLTQDVDWEGACCCATELHDGGGGSRADMEASNTLHDFTMTVVQRACRDIVGKLPMKYCMCDQFEVSDDSARAGTFISKEALEDVDGFNVMRDESIEAQTNSLWMSRVAGDAFLMLRDCPVTVAAAAAAAADVAATAAPSFFGSMHACQMRLMEACLPSSGLTDATALASAAHGLVTSISAHAVDAAPFMLVVVTESASTAIATRNILRRRDDVSVTVANVKAGGSLRYTKSKVKKDSVCMAVDRLLSEAAAPQKRVLLLPMNMPPPGSDVADCAEAWCIALTRVMRVIASRGLMPIPYVHQQVSPEACASNIRFGQVLAGVPRPAVHHSSHGTAIHGSDLTLRDVSKRQAEDVLSKHVRFNVRAVEAERKKGGKLSKWDFKTRSYMTRDQLRAHLKSKIEEKRRRECKKRRVQDVAPRTPATSPSRLAKRRRRTLDSAMQRMHESGHLNKYDSASPQRMARGTLTSMESPFSVMLGPDPATRTAKTSSTKKMLFHSDSSDLEIVGGPSSPRACREAVKDTVMKALMSPQSKRSPAEDLIAYYNAVKTVC